jgi:hypothetical protein
MRKGLLVLLTVVMVVAFALPAMAEVSFFGYARVIPTYYKDFDFNKNAGDPPTLNEGGLTMGEHIRSELRLGWKAGGDKWKIMMTAESDMIWNKNNADRSYYTNSVNSATNTIPNAGSEFGIERAEFSYAFLPALEVFAGWPISAVDIGTGGLLYGDDHPIIGFRGKITETIKYQLAYLSIQNTPIIGFSESSLARDWRAYFLKPDFTFAAGSNNKMTLSPIVLYSDYRGTTTGAPTAKVWYLGLEGIGQFGMFKPSFEVIFSDGEFKTTPTVNISSVAAFAGLEVAVHKAFNPYIAYRYTQGDDNRGDNDAEGFVGITDIGRFTPLMGMDGNILGENFGGPWASPLYSYAPDRAGNTSGGVSGPANLYGGISGASSGNNPGEGILAIGAKGNLDDYVKNLSYKTQLFWINYDQTGNLRKGAGKTPGSVDKYVGTTFDLQGVYAFSPNFSMNGIFSFFSPGDGIKDQLAASAASTTAQVYTLNLLWTY